MNDNYPSSSKQRLPFGLKVKPARKYIEHHSMYYESSKGKLLCLVTKTTKTDKDTLFQFEVTSKEQLNALSKAKTLDEIQRLTEVKN